MEIGILIIAFFTILIGVLIYWVDHPTKPPRKITGRGGDFNE